MTDTSRATLWIATDQQLRIRAKTVPGGSTPLALTGKTLKFVVRDLADKLVLSTTSIVIENGVEDDGVTATGGTDDMATVTIADTEIVDPVKPGEFYRGALWETAPADQPFWEGPVLIRRAPPQ